MSRAKDLALNWIYLSPKSHDRSFYAVLVTPGSPKGAFIVLFSYSFRDLIGLAFSRVEKALPCVFCLTKSCDGSREKTTSQYQT